MRVEQLKQLIVLENTLSLSKAAEQLYITKPALSLSLTRLENELGVKLFDRGPSGIQPTAAEREISAFVHSILQDIEKLQQLPEQFLSQKSTIILATLPTLYDDILLYLSQDYSPHTSVPMVILPESTEHILDSLSVGQCDIAIISCTDSQWSHTKRLLKARHLSHELLHTACFKLCLPPTHPLAGKQSIVCADIIQEPIFFLKDCTLFLQKCNLLNDPLSSLRISVEDLETLKKLVITEQGVGIVSHFNTAYDPYLEHDLLIVRDLQEPERLSYYLLYSEHRSQLPAEKLLMAQLRQWRINPAQ